MWYLNGSIIYKLTTNAKHNEPPLQVLIIKYEKSTIGWALFDNLVSWIARVCIQQFSSFYFIYSSPVNSYFT